MTGPHKVGSEIQHFQSRLHKNLPVTKQFGGLSWGGITSNHTLIPGTVYLNIKSEFLVSSFYTYTLH